MKTFFKMIIFVIIFTIINYNGYTQNVCQGPGEQTVVRSYEYAQGCTVKVQLCYQCYPITNKVIMGVGDLYEVECVPDEDMEDGSFMAWVIEKALREVDLLCGVRACTTGVIEVTVTTPICMYYDYTGGGYSGHLNLIDCGDNGNNSNYCWHKYSKCWVYVPPPGHDVTILIEAGHKVGTPDCEVWTWEEIFRERDRLEALCPFCPEPWSSDCFGIPCGE